jgi:hypothetical protein
MMRRAVVSLVLLAPLALVAVGCNDEGASSEVTQRNDPGPFRSLSLEVDLDPNDAGSEDKPRRVTLDLALRLGAPRAAEPPLLRTADVLMPEGIRYAGGRFPSCERRALERSGPEGCPRGSIMGEGALVARADTAPARGRITVVNGGADQLYFHTVLTNPLRTEAPMVGTITPAEAPWAYRLRLQVPEELQIVAGIPIAVRELRVTAGRDGWLSTTSCPDDSTWDFEGTAHFAGGGRAVRTATVDCEG